MASRELYPLFAIPLRMYVATLAYSTSFISTLSVAAVIQLVNDIWAFTSSHGNSNGRNPLPNQ